MPRHLVNPHTLERRSDMLAAAMKSRVASVSSAITPKGGRPPFTRKLSVQEALVWWLKHRYDPIGMAQYGAMTPLQQQELDAWLAQAVNHPGAQAAIQQAQDPTPMPTPQSVIRPAMSQEQRMQGPPIGPEVA